MAICKFRTESDERTFQEAVRVAVYSKEKGLKPICQIQVGELDPSCDLPEMSDTECPIALFANREISIDDCNARLTAIFDSRRQG